MKKNYLLIVSVLLLCTTLFSTWSLFGKKKSDRMKVMLYSSMKETQLAELKEGFMKKYPKIQMDYYAAGTGKVMTKIAAEEMAGNVEADVLWVGDPTDYSTLIEKKMLMPYVSPETKKLPKGLVSKDNLYCGARIVTLGLVYNSNNVKSNDVPQDWDDLLKPRFKDLAIMTDPTFSGTTLYTLAGLVQNPKYGWDFIKKLKENGMKLVKGSSDAIDKVGAGEYDLSIGVDYIARSNKKKGMPIGFVNCKSGISTITSPIAIMKTTKNEKAAKTLYDYILSLDGQQGLVNTDVIPVRPELKLQDAITVQEAVSRALPVDDIELSRKKEEYLKMFDEIFKTN